MGDYEVAMISTSAHPQAKLGFPGEFQNDPSLIPRNLKINSVNEEELDPTIKDKVKALNTAKANAI